MTADVLSRPRGVLSVPGATTGHTEITWDPDNEAEVAVARAAFDAAKAGGLRAYRRGDGEHGTVGGVIKEFDPDAGEIVIIPRPVGG